jgi:hypothetical protein
MDSDNAQLFEMHSPIFHPQRRRPGWQGRENAPFNNPRRRRKGLNKGQLDRFDHRIGVQPVRKVK